jgi:multidrug efflux system outer membrane protein
MIRAWPALGAIFAAFVLSAGCLKMGPDYARPEVDKSAPIGYQHANAWSGHYKGQDKWWQELGDERLNALVEEALKHNLDLKKAAARVLEYKAVFVEAKSPQFPTLGVEGKGSKSQSAISNPDLPAILLQSRRTEQYNLAAASSYEIDFWGRLARLEEAARTELLSVEENQRTAMHTIAAGVASSYLAMEALERRITVQERSLAAYHSNLALVENRYNRGLVSILDYQQARRALAQAKATLPQLRLDLGKEQQKLMVLLGRYPKTTPARSLSDDYFPNLKPVPPGLPSELLLRRPDLLAAEAKLQALNARIGVAKASRFPSIKLTGSFGFSTVDLNNLFSPQSELWSIAGGLTAPIFRGGELWAKQKAAEARYEQGVADYAKAVLEAFREVESALLSRKELMERRDLVQEALTEARATQDTAESRYQRGLTDYLRVLEAMQTRYALEDALVLVELAILTNRVSLHRALGGGWDIPAAGHAQGEQNNG